MAFTNRYFDAGSRSERRTGDGIQGIGSSILSASGDRNGPESSVENELINAAWDSSTLPRLEKHFYHEHSMTSKRANDMIQDFYNENQVKVKGHACPKPILTVEEAQFPDNVISVLQQHNWIPPRPIQAQAWPVSLSGRDVVCIAPAGSGKKLAYIIPGLIHIRHQAHVVGGDGPICLVLVPTGEHAQQVAQVAAMFGNSSDLRIACVYGCVSKAPQIRDLAEGAEICIATPGRLQEFLRNGEINLSRCSYLVLDAVDRMLDMGLEPQIRQIVNQIRPDRQTSICCTACPMEVQTLLDLLMVDYLVINIGDLDVNSDQENLPVVDDIEREETRFRNALMVGQEFRSYETANTAISDYQKASGIQFYRRDARKIESGRVKRAINGELKYYDLRYCCIHGGRKYSKPGPGKRDSSTYRHGCGAFIHISANETGECLVVRTINDNHNHEIHKELHRHLPQQRRLPSPLREEARELLKLKANKKMVQQYVVEKSGNLATLKDLSNLTKGSQAETRNDLRSFVDQLKNRYGATVDVLADEDETLRGLLFQDPCMHAYLQNFPEVLFVDATYKLLEIRMPIYLVLCEDSMGNTEVVSVGMLSVEDEESLSWLFATLRSRNPAMEKVRVIVTDKDIKERQVLRRCFPRSSLLLCLFHTLRTFRREVTCEKMTISAGQRLFCLDLLQKLAYARNESSYDSLYADFARAAPLTVKKYFDDNWHAIRREWVKGFACQLGNFLNYTNNRIECINSKLKSVINKFSSLEDFLEKLYIIIDAMRLERDSKAASKFLKTPSTTASTSVNATENQYCRLLTPYAAGYVIEQMKRSDKLVLRQVNDEKFAVEIHDCMLEVSATDCTCSFRNSMLLPCSHIFAARQKLSLDAFCGQLCDRRWHMEYFKTHGRVFAPLTETEHSTEAESRPRVTLQSVLSRTHRILSGPQKVKLGLQYATSLANLQADCGMTEFKERIELLKELERLWSLGKRAVVTELAGDDALERQEMDDNQAEIEEIIRDDNPTASEPITDETAAILSGIPFVNHTFVIIGFNGVDSETISILIARHGGIVLPYTVGCLVDFCVVPPFGCPVVAEVGELVTKAWVLSSIESGHPLPVDSAAIFSPMTCVSDASPLLGCVISFDGFTEIEMEVLLHIVTALGGTYQDKLSIEPNGDLQATTHLVYHSPHGFKYEAAKQGSIDVVNKMWLLECARTGRKMNVKEYASCSRAAETRCLTQPVDFASHLQSVAVVTTDELAVDEPVDALAGLKLPPRMRRCGRPKGQATTVIGLPKRRGGGRLLPFGKLPTSAKEKIILSWFVTNPDLEPVLRMHRQVSEDEVQRNSELVPSACTDEEVDTRMIRKYFTDCAWQSVEVLLRTKAENPYYTCGSCQLKLGQQSVACDRCLRWFDFKCVALKSAPKASRWFCLECRALEQ